MAEQTWTLTPETYHEVDLATDADGVYAKGYTQSVGGVLMTVGIRIGAKRGHQVAFWGDTVVRVSRGVWRVRPAEDAS